MFQNIGFLENGLKVLTYYDSKLKTTTASLWFNQGSKDESKNQNGLSHLVEHALIMADTMHERKELITNAGGMYNAETMRECTFYYSTVLNDSIENAFLFLAGLVQSAPDENTVNHEKQIIDHEYSQYLNSYKPCTDLFCQALWGDNDLGKSVIGNPKVLKDMTINDVNRVRESSYCAPNAALIVVGGCPPKKAFNYAKKYLSIMNPKGKINDNRVAQKGNRISIEEKNINQTILCMGFDGAPQKSKYNHVCELISKALGGGLHSIIGEKIRNEKKLLYAFGSFYKAYEYHGALSVWLMTNPSNINAVIEAIADEWLVLKRTGIDEKLLNACKKSLETEIHLDLEHTHNIMKRFGENILRGQLYSEEDLIRRIRLTSNDDILEYAENNILPDNFAISAYGDVSNLDIKNVGKLCGNN